MSEQERSCYECIHSDICFLQKRVYEALMNEPEEVFWMLRIDSNTPFSKHWGRLFCTLGEVCCAFKSKEERNMNAEMMKAVQYLVEVCEKVVKDTHDELDHGGQLGFDLDALETALAEMEDLESGLHFQDAKEKSA